MVRSAWKLVLSLAAVPLILIGAGRASAQGYVVSQPGISYYYPPAAAPCDSPPAALYPAAPQVSYYYAPPVSYYTPSVSYYTPSVSYYTAPAVSYYAAPAAVASGSAVTTTRYGLFGRPRVSSTYYYPGYVVP